MINTQTTQTKKAGKESVWLSDQNDCYKIICPFFRDLNGNTIRCEGLIPDTRTATSFRSARAMKRYRRGFCDTFSYDSCAICKALLKKYD